MKPKHKDRKGQQKVRLGNTASFSRDLERKINSKLMGNCVFKRQNVVPTELNPEGGWVKTYDKAKRIKQ